MGSRKLNYFDMFTTNRIVLVFDIDGVVAKYQYVKPEDRGPDKAPGIYSAMEPTIVQKFIKYIKANQYLCPHVMVVYLTTRDQNIVGQVTDEWLKRYGIDYPVRYVAALQDKIEILDKEIPDVCDVSIKGVLAFDDRYEELLTSRAIRNAHFSYPGPGRLIKASHYDMGIARENLYYDYPSMVMQILRRYRVFRPIINKVNPLYRNKVLTLTRTNPITTTRIVEPTTRWIEATDNYPGS